MDFIEPTETLVNYPLDGGNRRFPIPFDYLQRSFIRVTLFAPNQEMKLILGKDYNFIDSTTIETTLPYGGGDGWNRIQLRRYTSANRIVDFVDGAVLQAGDLNIATLQALHIAQEGRDISFDGLQPDLAGDLNARSRRITNLAEGINDSDAVTLGQIKSWDISAYNQAERARREADRAEAAGTTVLTPLKRIRITIKASELIDGAYQLPVMPVDCQVYLNGRVQQFEELGNFEVIGSILRIKGKTFDWDFFLVYINTEVLAYDESWNNV